MFAGVAGYLVYKIIVFKEKIDTIQQIDAKQPTQLTPDPVMIPPDSVNKTDTIF